MPNYGAYSMHQRGVISPAAVAAAVFFAGKAAE